MLQVYVATEDPTTLYGAHALTRALNQALAAVPTARYVAHTTLLVCNSESNTWQQTVTVIVDVPDADGDAGER
jgi:hypothetical protein